jgi:hypothetical protein
LRRRDGQSFGIIGRIKGSKRAQNEPLYVVTCRLRFVAFTLSLIKVLPCRVYDPTGWEAPGLRGDRAAKQALHIGLQSRFPRQIEGFGSTARHGSYSIPSLSAAQCHNVSRLRSASRNEDGQRSRQAIMKRSAGTSKPDRARVFLRLAGNRKKVPRLSLALGYGLNSTFLNKVCYRGSHFRRLPRPLFSFRSLTIRSPDPPKCLVRSG